jgi:3-deoxy-D-manno-octulosonic acid kinase
MNIKTQQSASRAIVYDADCIQQPDAGLFSPDYWNQKGAIVETAAGRGNALLLDTEFGPLVLRAYLRGGWAARMSRDQYVFTGYERSRPFVEIRILERMLEMGLPVPRPFAGLCQRNGLSYSAVLITHRIASARVLADLLDSKSDRDTDWIAIGRCIRCFHDAGVVHPDLNVRNIMIKSSGEIFLIDFDRAQISPGAGKSFQNNLDRLYRSLVKFWPVERAGELESCWIHLTNAYKNPLSGF